MPHSKINLILNAEISGTTSTHIGSVRILTGSNSQIGFRAMMGSTIASISSVQFQRFNNGTYIAELTSSGKARIEDVSGSSLNVGAGNNVYGNEWYDIYASGSHATGSALIKGIRITLH